MESKIYKCKLKTLSPIHIGSGKDYGPSEYVKAKAKQKGKPVNIIKRVDFAKFYTTLDETDQEKFLSDLSNSDFRLEQYDPKISKEFTRYNSIDRTKTEPTDIVEHIKTSDKLYIPGSSIKGAIKTAIFYKLFEINDTNDVHRLIRRSNRGGFIDRRGYNKFIDSYFSAPRGNSAQTSIMRFLHIPDTTTIKTPTIHEVVSVMAKERGRMPDGNQFYSRRGNTIRSFLETIDKGKVLKSDFNISYDKKIINKIGLSDKMDILDINYIKKSIYEFSDDLIQYELEFADKYDIKYLTNFYNKISKLNTKETPLLRIGAGSGLMATTIGMKIKDYDSNLFEKIRGTFKRSYPFEFPKSRKVTKYGQPLSWVQLNFID